jgi:nitroreductase
MVWRRAVKHFGKSQVGGAKLDIEPVLEAINLAPSSFGITPFKVHSVGKKESPRLLKAVSRACYDNMDKVAKCDYLLAFCARTDAAPTLQDFYDEHKKDGTALVPEYEQLISGFLGGLDTEAFYNWSSQQTMIALGFGLAAAGDLRIASCPMAGFDPVAVGSELNLPANQRVTVLLALGAEPDEPEEFPKWRFPLDRVVTRHAE